MRSLGKFFTFYRKEHTGALLLLILLLAVGIVPRLYFSFREPTQLEFNEDSAQIANLIAQDKKINDSLRKRSYYRPSIYSMSQTQLMQLGVNQIKAKQISEQIKKHGIKSYGELARISGLDSNQLKKVVYINPNAGVGISKQPEYSKANKLELNTADSIQLLKLKGIGPYYAHKILEYRKKLGGYYKTEQLFEIRNLDTQAIRMIQPVLSINSNLIVKIPIRGAYKLQLEAHPYLNYKEVKALLAFVEQHQTMTIKNFTEHPAINANKKAALKYYLSFD